MLPIRIAAIALAATVVAAPAGAQTQKEWVPFERAAFVAAQARGAPILLDVHAWWCPVCRSQARTIKRVTTSDAFAKLVVFRINYDSQKDVWRSFNVQKQATLIAFHGTRETGRIAYMTDQVKIADLIASTNR